MRYVDDSFVCVKNLFDISTILEIANNIDPHIQFTFDTHNKLHFLDVLVVRYDSFFKTCVYRKTFSASIMLHALSNHPPNQKIDAFYIYVYRPLKICSDLSSLNSELYYLKTCFFFFFF